MLEHARLLTNSVRSYIYIDIGAALEQIRLFPVGELETDMAYTNNIICACICKRMGYCI